MLRGNMPLAFLFLRLVRILPTAFKTILLLSQTMMKLFEKMVNATLSGSFRRNVLFHRHSMVLVLTLQYRRSGRVDANSSGFRDDATCTCIERLLWAREDLWDSIGAWHLTGPTVDIIPRNLPFLHSVRLAKSHLQRQGKYGILASLPAGGGSLAVLLRLYQSLILCKLDYGC